MSATADKTVAQTDNLVSTVKKIRGQIVQIVLPGIALGLAFSFWGGDPVIKLDKVSPRELKKLLWRAHLSFYARPKRLFSVVLPFFLSTSKDSRKGNRI